MCENIAQTETRIKVSIGYKKWNKYATSIHGLNPKEFDLKKICKSLQGKLACGGSVKDGIIELPVYLLGFLLLLMPLLL